MSTIIPGATTAAYGGYSTAMPAYGGYSTAAYPTTGYSTGYAAPMTSMSYGTSMPMSYGGYGAPTDSALVKTQLDDATKVLETQYGVQDQMLEAEKKRMLSVMTMQYEQQYTQQKLSIEQAYKQ